MSANAFVTQFRRLHEKAKSKTLTAAERLEYTAGRSQLMRLVIVAQQMGHAGATLRSNLRMAKLLKVELRPEGGDTMRVSTIDLASGGFAALIQGGLKVGHSAAFTLHLPGGAPMTGRCVVASSRPQSGAFRVSFRFDNLSPAAQEQLDMVLIDAVLERFV
jgi:hypothetical protein